MLNIIKIPETGCVMDAVIREAMAIINLYPDVFPHLYKQGYKLISRIQKGELVMQDGVVLTFHQYRRRAVVARTSTYRAKPYDFIIHQIATNKFVKNAAKQVLDEFVGYCAEKGAANILLTVRTANQHVCKFYMRYGFVFVDKVCWHSKKTGIIAGHIYAYPIIKNKIKTLS